MINPKRYLVTAALPYANGPVHIGHLAGCYLPADIYVRYLRSQKRDVQFVGGSDEHGVPITIRALKEGITPQQVVDRYHAQIKESMEQMGISFNIYSRTSNPVHHKTASDFFKKMYDDGLFEEKETEQYYDESTNTFLADRYIVGTCPVCANPNAYGDQCEKCGSTLSPEQLINPRSTLSDAVPIKKKTTHWYFPLQDYEPWLKEWLIEGHKEWKNNVYGQCKSWLDNGLHSRAMTRDSNWGIKVPKLAPPPPKGGILETANSEETPESSNAKNPPLEGREAGKVLYVWFDAPIGYISATKELTENWADYWCKDDTKLVHFIGKDNIVFHCIIFPAMLKAHGGFVLPENVPANEFLNIEGEKVSTSRNWAVWVHEYIKDFAGCEDVLRYVLCANAPETKDNDFTWKDFQDRNNSELVSIFGNFVNRTWVLMHKLCGGKVPKLHEDILDEKDKALIEDIAKTKVKVESLLEEFKFRDALFEVIDLSRKGNKYMQEKEPWIVAKKLASQNPSEGGASDSENTESLLGYQTADPFVYGLLKTFVSEHRSNPTETENILWQILRGKKLDSYKFRRQHIIGSYIADFVCLSQKLIVEVDGLIHQIPENLLSDGERTAELKKFGFEVIRFTNEEVINNTDSVLNSILSKLSEKNSKESEIKNPPLEGREAAQKSIDNCLHLCLQLTANLAILINPFLPTTAQKMLGMMKVVDKMLDWNNAGKVKLLSVGYSLREPQLLFRKIEDAEITAQVEKLKAGASLNPSKGGTLEPAKLEDAKKLSQTLEPTVPASINPEKVKEAIQFDDFAKIDLKVGTILSAEKVEKADKLLKLQIDLGFEVRTVVSGIALHFQPEAIVGKQVVVVANLAPRKMRGIESNGMILMAEDADGKLKFVSPAEVVNNGSGVT